MTSERPLAPRCQALRRGDLAVRASVEEACQRIDAVEHDIAALVPEPRRRERLLAEAEALDRRASEPAAPPPLYGLLVGVKDVIHVDGFVTEAGSAVPSGAFAGREASSVRALKDAGALILGKTITAEFACSAPNATRNPHNLAHTPGGSSSGSAAAVAAGYCELALGTQTVGSVIRPAAFCGVVGLKPSMGRIPKDGIVDYSPTPDTLGLFTQDVAGMAIAASVLCAGWQASTPSAHPTLGVPDGPYLEQTSSEGREAFERQVSVLCDAGYRVIRVPMFSDHQQLMDRHYTLITAEMALSHRDIYAEHAHGYRAETVDVIERGKTISEADYMEARSSPIRVRQQIEAAMEENGIDLWACPAALGPAPAGIDSTGSPFMNLVWTHAGLPALTVPAGCAANGLPLGLQLVGRFNADEHLLAWAEGLATVVKDG